MKTGFGERVHELRKRIMAVGTPLRDWDELIEVELPARITKAVAEAVADERERMLASVAIMFDKGSEQSRDKLFASIRNAIACSELVPPPVPPPEPMTIATMMEKLLAGYPVWKDECDLRSDLTALVQAARDKGFEEGESKQAILEVQGRDGFLAESKCRNCGHSLKDSRRHPPPAEKPMTTSSARGRLAVIVHNTYENHRIVEDVVTTLVQDQARRDAERCSKVAMERSESHWRAGCHECRMQICTSAGLE